MRTYITGNRASGKTHLAKALKEAFHGSTYIMDLGQMPLNKPITEDNLKMLEAGRSDVDIIIIGGYGGQEKPNVSFDRVIELAGGLWPCEEE